jgi:hypothetical protein
VFKLVEFRHVLIPRQQQLSIVTGYAVLSLFMTDLIPIGCCTMWMMVGNVHTYFIVMINDDGATESTVITLADWYHAKAKTLTFPYALSGLPAAERF